MFIVEPLRRNSSPALPLLSMSPSSSLSSPSPSPPVECFAYRRGSPPISAVSALDRQLLGAMAGHTPHFQTNNNVSALCPSRTVSARSCEHLKDLVGRHYGNTDPDLGFCGPEDCKNPANCDRLMTLSEDMNLLVRNITKEAKALVQAEICSLFLLDKEHSELVAEVFEKNGTTDEYLTEIRMPLSEGIVGQVATTGQMMNVKDVYNHPYFYNKVDERTGFITRNILCFPIKDSTGHLVGVAELCNKIGKPSFTKHDEQIATTFAVYCAISISHGVVPKRCQSAVAAAPSPLRMTGKDHLHHNDHSHEEEDKLLILAGVPQRSQRRHRSQTANSGCWQGAFREMSSTFITLSNSLISFGDVCRHHLYHGSYFRDPKPEILISPCVRIHEVQDELEKTEKCLLYRKLQEAHRRSHMAAELLVQGSTLSIAPEDILRLTVRDIPASTSFHPDFCSFDFFPRSIGGGDIYVEASLSMFKELGFIERYRLKRRTLARFLLMVQKGYRDVPYHNWSHAFAVAHFCFLLLKMPTVQHALNDLERLSLLVACLCHDIDHRGTTNAFQLQSKTPLAQLYSSEGSVLERHHFAQTVSILSMEECNIFEQLTRKQYQTVLDHIREIILATDIAAHLRKVDKIKAMVDDGYDRNSPDHHYLFMCLLMTASDLSDQTKPFKYAKLIAENIYREFFSQGDLEKQMGNRPIEMMDRERAFVPKMQLDFMDTVAVPVFDLLARLLPDLQGTYNTMIATRECWETMEEVVAEEGFPSRGGLEYLRNPDLERKVEQRLQARRSPKNQMAR
ncbi:hypothetical protein L596_025783 [Steinernema carpocapsae]|uniref:Phosphodiesterase n=1 Tax=Steinernema carpocapsae TaxID=34508 RepID=A0A4U5M913_STECR|nr:hypothetical protein L596_025783 [Steinernema carpocapsae]